MLREAKKRNRNSISMHIHFHPSSEENTKSKRCAAQVVLAYLSSKKERVVLCCNELEPSSCWHAQAKRLVLLHSFLSSHTPGNWCEQFQPRAETCLSNDFHGDTMSDAQVPPRQRHQLLHLGWTLIYLQQLECFFFLVQTVCHCKVWEARKVY